MRTAAMLFKTLRILQSPMRIRTVLATCALIALVLFSSSRTLCAQAPAPTGPHTLKANGDHFELDAKPFQIISAPSTTNAFRAHTGVTVCAKRGPWD